MRRRLLAIGALAALVLAVPRVGREDTIVTTLTLFAGTAEGLWRTTNWGGSWERVHGRTAGVSIEGLGAVRAIVPIGRQVWVAGDGGLYESDDFGVTWVPLAQRQGVHALLLSRWPQADPTVFVGTALGLFRSRDGGRTFEPTALTDSAVFRLDWPGPDLVVACDRGLLITTDEGGRFEGPGAGLPEGGVRAMVVSSYFALDPVLFAAPVGGGVFRSSDRGKSWKAVGLAGEKVFDLVWLGPFLYAAGEEGFYRSQDAGETWSRLSKSPGRPARIMFPLAPAAGIEAFLATDRGIFRTADAGEHWEPAGLAGMDVLTIATFPPPDPAPSKKKRR
jgi:photosystem II stability/assembly factor-like uncharacterized protein